MQSVTLLTAISGSSGGGRTRDVALIQAASIFIVLRSGGLPGEASILWGCLVGAIVGGLCRWVIPYNLHHGVAVSRIAIPSTASLP